MIKYSNTNDNIWYILFILPALLGTLVFILIPTFGSFYISFTEWDFISPAKFVGFTNYVELLSDPMFYKVLINTFIFSFFTITGCVILPLFLAILLNLEIRHIVAYRTVYFLPFITPLMVVGIIWSWLYDPNNGVINYFLSLFSLPEPDWLFDTTWAMVAIIITTVWKYIGYNMVFYLAGLQAIPAEIYDSAEIDGANSGNKLFKITLPLLTPTIFFVSIITAVQVLQSFELIYIMTSGGPNNSTMLVVYWLYKLAFEFFQLGKASAVAYILFFIILGLTLIQWKLRKKWVLHE